MKDQEIRRANFFLVGAAKSGTSSIYDVLQQHPSIFLSPIKEPNYFSTDIKIEDFSTTYKNNTFLDTDSYFKQKPLKPIQLSFVRNSWQYQQLFEAVENEKIIGDCSTSYLYSKKAAHKIFEYNPDAKILICLRDPIERCFSHYLMALKYGHTSLSFRKAIEKDLAKTNKGWGISELFIELGQYKAQIDRYKAVFPEHQIHIIKFNDLIKQPDKVYQGVYNFLSIPAQSIPSYSKSNPASAPKYPKLNAFISNSGIKRGLLKLIPTTLVNKLKSNYYQAEALPTLSEADKTYISKMYTKEIEFLKTIFD